LKQIQGVAVASLTNDSRWPKPGPDVDHGEDPYWPFLASHHRSDLINLKFRDGESFDFAMAEPTTPGSRSFQPTMNCIPGNALGSSDGRFVQAFDAKSCHLIKDRATVLESMIRCAGCRAERLPTSPASVSTTLPHLVLWKPWRTICPLAAFRGKEHWPLGQLRLFIRGTS
jgi:hypothetical protein